MKILRKKRMCKHYFSIRKEISREVIGEGDANLSFFYFELSFVYNFIIICCTQAPTYQGENLRITVKRHCHRKYNYKRGKNYKGTIKGHQKF